MQRWSRSSVSRSVAVLGAIGALWTAPAPGQSVCEVDHVSASDGGGFNNFGRAVAVSGDSSLIGASFVSRAYAFRFDGANWVETQTLQGSDVVGGDNFGKVLAMDGQTGMIGAPNHDHGPAVGSVYVFQDNGSRWVEVQELVPLDLVGGSFGITVSLSGDVAVIGAPTDDSAYVFRRSPLERPPGSQWLQEQKLLTSDGTPPLDGFGSSVAVRGDVALIGGADSEAAFLAGAAYVFRFDGISWVQEQKLTASDAAAFDCFGRAVALSAETALIGAPDKGVTGAAYVFQFDPATSQWLEVQKLIPHGGDGAGQFGQVVALEGATALVGAFAGPDDGAAYVFRLVDGTWREQQRLFAAPAAGTAFFGRGVALSGDVAVVGANGENGQAGGAYMYTGLVGLDCNANGRADACDILFGLREDTNGNGIPDTCECPWDLDGGGTVGIKDFLALLAAWGPNPGHPADFDGDGVVGITDFLALLANWGACP